MLYDLPSRGKKRKPSQLVKKQQKNPKTQHSLNVCTICVIINDCTYPGLKSLQKAVLRWGSQNERFIPNRCTLCCCFVQVFIKSPWAWGKVFTYSFIVHVQQTAISLTRTLSPIWAHTEVIKRMFSGTYNNRNNELYSKGEKSLKWEGKKRFFKWQRVCKARTEPHTIKKVI